MYADQQGQCIPQSNSDVIRAQGPLDALKERQLRLSQELRETSAAIDALESNPEVARVLDVVGRALGRGLGRY